MRIGMGMMMLSPGTSILFGRRLSYRKRRGTVNRQGTKGPKGHKDYGEPCFSCEKVQRLKGLTFPAFFIMLRRGMEAVRLTLTVSLHDVSNQSGPVASHVGASGCAAP
jgi:hypothetical protein